MNRGDRIVQDTEWRAAGLLNGWTLPAPAAWPWRLPVIWRFRYAWHRVKAEDFAARWGYDVTAYDLWVLYGIARGWA